MRIDFILIQAAVIFLPGLLWEKFDKTFSAKIKPDTASFIMRAFVFGIISYAITYFLYLILGYKDHYINLNISDADKNIILNKESVICICVSLAISLFLSVIWVFIHGNKIFTKFTQKVKLTKKYGDEDVWDYILNKNHVNKNKIFLKYITLYDYKNNIIYCGYLDSFSETEKDRELFLTSVKVYNSEGDELYSLDNLYLGLDKESICMEIKDIPPPQNSTPSSP